MNQQVLDMQAQTIEQMKGIQNQALEMNDRIAESMTSVASMVPEMPASIAEYVPTPAEMVGNYFDFMGEVRNANRQFVESMMAAWAPAAAPAKSKKK